MTATGITLGTPMYMSPEQASGGILDGRSDLYSLGCVLYEMLAGEPPFTGATPQSVIAKRLNTPPPRIRTVRPGVPTHLEELLLRVLDRTPADCFATAGEFQTVLDGCARSDATPRVSLVRRPVVSAAIGMVVVAALAVGWSIKQRFATPLLTSLAVLPFTNASKNPEHAFLAEGLADALTSDLVRVPGVRLVSRMSVMRYASMGGAMSGMAMPGGMAFMSGTASGAGKTMENRKSLAEIGRELRVDALLQGTLEREGDIVRVAASRVRPDSGQRVWQGSYNRHVRELFRLQRDLAEGVATAMTRGGARRVEQPVGGRELDPAAHEAYLKASYYQAHWKLPQAVESFERAVSLNSGHAAAQAGLARAYYFLGFFGDIPPSIALAGMRRACRGPEHGGSPRSTGARQDALLRAVDRRGM